MDAKSCDVLPYTQCVGDSIKRSSPTGPAKIERRLSPLAMATSPSMGLALTQAREGFRIAFCVASSAARMELMEQ